MRSPSPAPSSLHGSCLFRGEIAMFLRCFEVCRGCFGWQHQDVSQGALHKRQPRKSMSLHTLSTPEGPARFSGHHVKKCLGSCNCPQGMSKVRETPGAVIQTGHPTSQNRCSPLKIQTRITLNHLKQHT